MGEANCPLLDHLARIPRCTYLIASPDAQWAGLMQHGLLVGVWVLSSKGCFLIAFVDARGVQRTATMGLMLGADGQRQRDPTSSDESTISSQKCRGHDSGIQDPRFEVLRF